MFLDANLLMSIIFERSEQRLARRVMAQYSDQLYISSLTGHLVFHFGKKVYTIDELHEFIGDYTILPLESCDFEWAYNNRRNDDFEDALQLAVAIRGGCKRFVTFDSDLYGDYKGLLQVKVELLA
jgi:predicted nucleic acid-binding protein